MISADDFTFEYPTADEPALRDLSLSVDEGSVLGVVGPVEAGKTTLSMALSGFVPETTGGWSEGDLAVAGRDPRTTDANDVAMVFEEYSAQLSQLRVIDEVIAPLTNRGVPRERALDRARELLDEVRLDESEEKFTWELSGGQQQRLAVAAALAVDPEVLVFDTATDMLDPQGRAEVADLVASLAGETTLVVTENDPGALVGIADELLVLEDGREVASGDADDLLRDRELLEQVGVGAPLCLDVAQRVGLDASPVTLGEFREAYADDSRRALVQPTATPDGGPGSPAAVEPSGADADDATASTADPVIDVDDATYEYPDGTVAVEDVDLAIRAGEVHAVVGGNGAGKSTLSKLLVGVMAPSSGTVRIGGRDTADATARELGSSVGIALQNPDEQISRETVEDEIRYPLEQRRYERSGPFGLFGKRERYGEDYIERRLSAVRDLVGIDDDLMDEDPAFLPLGERSLVAMAAALAPDPDAVVLDEPAAGIDASGREAIEDAIDRLRADGTGVVLVDHDMDFVCEVADRVTVLADGRISTQGPPEELFARDNWEWLAERHIRPPRAARLAHRVGVDAVTADGVVDELAPATEVPR